MPTRKKFTYTWSLKYLKSTYCFQFPLTSFGNLGSLTLNHILGLNLLSSGLHSSVSHSKNIIITTGIWLKLAYRPLAIHEAITVTCWMILKMAIRLLTLICCWSLFRILHCSHCTLLNNFSVRLRFFGISTVI